MSDSGSIRETVSLSVFATQTASSPTAIPFGFSPTAIGSASASRAPEGIRETVPSRRFVTQTAPAPVATPNG